MKPLAPALAHAAILFAAFSCASAPPPPEVDPAYPLPEASAETWQAPVLSEAQRLIAEGGPTLVGKKTLVVNGVTYPNDCTGVVRAAYAFASMDIAFRFGEFSGNGVRRLYETLRSDGLLYSVRYPEPGDLVFWDNTWDANGNKLADDELTHVGVVMSVEADGSIRYLHYNYSKGTVIERMNLVLPGDELYDEEGLLNSPLRMRGSPEGPGSGSAQLFRVFGKGHELKIP